MIGTPKSITSPRQPDDADADALIDAAVRAAVASWQRAHLTPRHLTRRTDKANRHRRARALRAIDRILDDPALLPPERDALARVGLPFRRMVESIFDAPTNAQHRPAVRAEGYRDLARCVRELIAAGSSEDAAIRRVVERLLAMFPSEKNPVWLYDLEPSDDALSTLVNRLSVHVWRERRKETK